MIGSEVLIIGIGNEHRGDDGVGIAVARKMKHALPQISVIEQSGEGTALLEAWRDAEMVVVIDAVFSGGTPGTVHRFDAHEGALPTKRFRSSSHEFGLPQAVELARILNMLPPHLIIYGVEGKNFEPDTLLSSEVEHIVNKVAEEIGRELKSI